MGEEARKSHAARLRSGFIARYLSGPAILDIGYKGYLGDVVPIVPGATGVELDYPGYDGVTLPFADFSQDAVFASHCLEHIADFRNALRDWFRVLKTGGHLVIMVPHKFLYEKKTELPSNYNDDHKRFYTPASLMAEVEASLPPNAYRLRHLLDNDTEYDYSIPPDRHSGGCYEIELVIEKISPPAWDLAKPPAPDPGETASALPRRDRAQAIRAPAGGHDVAIYAFGTSLPARPRILALKLDHLGDFIIGVPSLRRLRSAFPNADIHLVVGSWNRIAAEASGLADQVRTYDYFPQNGFGWDGTPTESLERFRATTAGVYDIAIDLRVDEDTRFLLKMVEATLRCGIGPRTRFPFLDVALPPEHESRRNPFALDPRQASFGVERFQSRMPRKGVFHHETDFRELPGHAIFGPHIALPPGTFRAWFILQLYGWTIGLRGAQVTLDIARAGEIVALRRLEGRELRGLIRQGQGGKTETRVELCFENDDTEAIHEFRVHVQGRPLRTTLRFAGVSLDHTSAPAAARFRRAELHIGEQLSLLVQLLEDRTAQLYEPPPQQHGRARHVVMAPFSNSDLRDWPASYYVRLIRLLVDQLDCTVTLVGSQSQATALEQIRVQAGRGAKVSNLGGRTRWVEMPELLRQASLVICNNSGIAHLAASVGALTLAIYAASHQPQEWGARGTRSHAVMAVVPCSPCGHDRLSDCPNDHTCMRGLMPETVLGEAAGLLGIALTAQGLDTECTIRSASNPDYTGLGQESAASPEVG